MDKAGNAVPPRERPYKADAPARDALVSWPDDFGTRFTVMADTEEAFDWSAPFRRDGWSVGAVEGLPEAHRRFAGAGVPLTYLIDYPIAADARAVEILHGLIEDGVSSIGAQLHPWVNPPMVEELSDFNSFVGNLPKNIEAAKIDALTDRIIAGFGFSPRIFRAGRYGIGANTLALLAERGYRIDSSMRSRYDYSADGGPDFRSIANHAFHTGPGSAIVELPLTTIFVGILGARGRRMQRSLGNKPLARGLLARLGMLGRVAMTPEDMPVTDVLEAIRIAVDRGVRLLNFSFHSPSLVPGNTPYVRDHADLAAFYRWWDAVFALLDRLRVAPASERDMLAALGETQQFG